MQQVVKAVDEHGQQGSKTHPYSDPYVDNEIDLVQSLGQRSKGKYHYFWTHPNFLRPITRSMKAA